MAVISLLSLIQGCTSLDFDVALKADQEQSVYVFTDSNPSSATYNQEYVFVLEVGSRLTKDSPYVVSFPDLTETVVLNFFEPWCQPCMAELPDLERLAEENDVPVFGFTADYTSAGLNGMYIENTISYSFFQINVDDSKYKGFLHEFTNPTDVFDMERILSKEVSVDSILLESGPIIEMDLLPKTVFSYENGVNCLVVSSRTYEKFQEKITDSDCPREPYQKEIKK